MQRENTRPAVGTVESGGLPPLRETDIAAGILPRLRTVIETRGSHLAAVDGHTRITYVDLAARAAEVCGRVEGLIGGDDAPVALVAGHDVATVVSLVGILASGRPVVVLDERTPVTWQKRLTTQVGARLVVADGTNRGAMAAARAIAGPGMEVLATTTDTTDPAGLWATTPDAEVPAVVAFTSGTTGATKPVVGSHRLIVRDAWNSSVAACCYDAADVLAQTLPLPFHAGLTTTLHALLTGATLRLIDVRADGVSGLPQIVADDGATLLVTSPAILRGLVASAPDPRLLVGLHGLTVAGDAVYGRDIVAAQSVLPSWCVIRNRYGASEAGLIAEAILNDVPDGRLPIGRAVGWTRMDVVDDEGRAVPMGAKGRIAISAPDLASGYWGQPNHPSFGVGPDGLPTFLTSDIGRRLPDGSIDLLGRSDDAISVRGYLVDPGEVEAVALTLPGVRECLVAGRETATGIRLVAYVVGEAGSDPTAIRTRLRDRLPGHMVPAEVVALASLPRTDRGKIDRRSLPETSASTETVTLTHWEQLVADAWSQVLGVSDVHAGDDFFTLGGDSLAAEELMARLRDDLAVAPARATSRTLVESPTLRGFAAAVAPPAGRTRSGLVTLHAAGGRTPLFVVAGAGGAGRTFATLAHRLGPDQPVHALQAPALEGRSLPDLSISAMARRHLTAVLDTTDGPLALAGHAFGGLLALEMARQARESGRSVPLVVLLDVTPPEHVPHDARPAWRRAKSGLGLAVASLRHTDEGDEAWRWQVQADALAAGYTVPDLGDTRVVVITASDGPSPQEQDPWESRFPDARRRHVPGGPLTMLRPPYVDHLAAALQVELADATDAQDGRRA